jgi:preprotein translocase subunit SecG
MDQINFINIILIANSLFLIILIFNQNDNIKNTAISKSSGGSSSLENPFEKITWVSLFFQLTLLLFKVKNF